MTESKHHYGNPLHNEALAARVLASALRDGGEDEDGVELGLASETSLLEAVDAALSDMRDAETLAAAIGERVKTMGARQSRLAERVKRLRGAIAAALEVAELTKLTLPEATISLGHGRQTLVVTDEAAIPDAFWTVKEVRVLDRKGLADTLESGPVAGAALSNGAPVLSVRTK